jgi:SAM-dependent methyltransferase
LNFHFSLIATVVMISKKELYRTVQRYAPGPAKSWAAQAAEYVARSQFETFARRCFGARWVPVDRGPPGPAEIIMRTAVLRQQEVEVTTTSSYYFASAYSQLLAYLRALERQSFNFRGMKAIYEIGCGSGRLIRHWRNVEGLKVTGSDVEASSVAWCSENLPGIDFHVNDLLPPLSFIPDNSLDVVYASSVFTHIDIKDQDAWLLELKRVLRPGGILMCDVHGIECRRQVLTPELDAKVEKEGGLVVYPGQEGSSVSTDVIGSCDTFQTEAETRRVFGTHFELLDYIAKLRDLLVLRKSEAN